MPCCHLCCCLLQVHPQAFPSLPNTYVCLREFVCSFVTFQDESEDDDEKKKKLAFLKKFFENWKIAYDCITDYEEEPMTDEKIINLIMEAQKPIDPNAFIGGTFVPFHFIFVLFWKRN